MIPLDIIQYFATVCAIIGAILNAKRHWIGFLFWIVGNCGWLAFALATQSYGLFVTYIVFQGASILGVYEWKLK